MNYNGQKQNRQGRVCQVRRQTGSSFVELTAVGSLMVVAALVGLNICVVLFGVWINDAACREAARAAAQQTNAQEAEQAAIKAASTHAIGGGLFTSPKVLLNGQNFEFVTFLDGEGNPQFDEGHFVRVTTTMTAKLPAPLICYGARLPDKFTFQQSYCYPILNPAPATGNDAFSDQNDD